MKKLILITFMTACCLSLAQSDSFKSPLEKQILRQMRLDSGITISIVKSRTFGINESEITTDASAKATIRSLEIRNAGRLGAPSLEKRSDFGWLPEQGSLAQANAVNFLNLAAQYLGAGCTPEVLSAYMRNFQAPADLEVEFNYLNGIAKSCIMDELVNR
jgi:hypothetical protein